MTVKAVDLRIDRQGAGQFTGILSNANEGSAGDAGSIDIEVTGLFELAEGAAISGNTFSEGNAGIVTVRAGDLRIDRQGSSRFTGIQSSAGPDSTGNAGSVDITVAGLLELAEGAYIACDTFSEGNGGTVKVQAGAMRIDGRGYNGLTAISSDTTSTGNAGSVDITVAGLLELAEGATIMSFTTSAGNAGMVRVQAGAMQIDGRGDDRFTGISSDATSTGHAGSIDVAVAGLLELVEGAKISSTTLSEGNAGTVRVQAGAMQIDGRGDDGFTGIATNAETDSTGDAGDVDIDVAGLLELAGGAEIHSSTSSEGNAGTVRVQAGAILIDARGFDAFFTGIGSMANPNATGQVGDVIIQANRIQLRDGVINIAHFGTLNDTALENPRQGQLTIAADTLNLDDDSWISAEASQNAPASAIQLQIADRLLIENNSRITTEANTGDGGPITLTGPGAVLLRNGQITTSTESGNGGNISLAPGALILDNGFIQANTGGTGASGGDIRIDTDLLIVPSDQSLAVGDNERLSFQPNSGLNVIQAAAPDGVSGALDVPALTLNLATDFAGVDTGFEGLAGLGKDPCHVGQGQKPSSLVFAGRGSLHADVISHYLGLDVLPSWPTNQDDEASDDTTKPNNPQPRQTATAPTIDCQRSAQDVTLVQ